MLQREIEAMLFAVGAPISIERLKELTGAEEEEIRSAAAALETRLAEEVSGVQLIRVENAYQLCTKPDMGEAVKRALDLKKSPPLSRASLEVLAIIAYNQPATRGFVEQVRGVDSDYIVSSLADKGLVYESGQLDAPGRPALFSTTDAFLRCFGLSSLEELPKTELPNPQQMSIADGEVALEENTFAKEPSEIPPEPSSEGEAP